jgi:hypothetical protein
MDRSKGNATNLVLTTEPIENRRQLPRVVGPFNLTFSGMDKDHMIMGEGIVIDLSREGIGVRGNRFVKPGMHLALFIELPGSEEHFCIPDARVSWMMGSRFGLHVETLSLDDQSRLCTFLGTHQQLNPFRDQRGRANSRLETANGGTTTMNWWKSESQSPEEKSKSAADRRKEPRINGRFKVRYSGSDANKIVMGHATIVDLSRHGFGIEGARGLKLGMELALFLELPDADDKLCIPQAYVSWIDGRRFGVEVRGAKDKDPIWLECLASHC